MSLVLRFLPAIVLGLFFTLGTWWVQSNESSMQLFSCDVCPASEIVDFSSRGFPFSFVEDKLDDSNPGPRLATANDKISDLQLTSFVASWIVWSAIAAVILLAIKKLRNTLGNIALAVVIAGVALAYFGIIQLA